MNMVNESHSQEPKLLALSDLSRMLGISQMVLHRAAVRDLFPCMRTPNGRRLVSSDDKETLTILTNAARLFNDPELDLSIFDSIRLARRGVNTEPQNA